MILVFGKTGQVAMELQRQANVRALGREEADLNNPLSCANAILVRRPSVVINAAAYTAVDQAEDEEDLATVANGESPGAMAQVCAELEIPFLHVSTDYVFDGAGFSPRNETHDVSPINAYGRAKLAGERAILAAGGQSIILRTSWVFSSHGRNFVKTMLDLAYTRNSLNIVDDQIGGPTPADKIAEALLVIASKGTLENANGIYHFAGRPNVSWADFARGIFQQSNTEVRVNGISTQDYPTPAKRPLNSRLDCSKLKADFGIDQPDWKEGLSRVLVDLKKSEV